MTSNGRLSALWNTEQTPIPGFPVIRPLGNPDGQFQEIAARLTAATQEEVLSVEPQRTEPACLPFE